VSRAVGGSVVRHSVARRLRHQLAPLLSSLPAGTRVVVRALPASATASSAELGAELRRTLTRALDKARGASAAGGPA
jgi:ribonuclease P protein component